MTMLFSVRDSKNINVGDVIARDLPDALTTTELFAKLTHRTCCVASYADATVIRAMELQRQLRTLKDVIVSCDPEGCQEAIAMLDGSNFMLDAYILELCDATKELRSDSKSLDDARRSGAGL